MPLPSGKHNTTNAAYRPEHNHYTWNVIIGKFSSDDEMFIKELWEMYNIKGAIVNIVDAWDGWRKLWSQANVGKPGEIENVQQNFPTVQ